MSNLAIRRFFNVLPSDKIFPIIEGVQRRSSLVKKEV